MLPLGWGHPFFRLPALWLVPDRGVGTSSSGLQKWTPPIPQTSDGPGYVSGVFNTARFLAPIVGRIANAHTQEKNVHTPLTMHGTLVQRELLALTAQRCPRYRGFLSTRRRTAQRIGQQATQETSGSASGRAFNAELSACHQDRRGRINGGCASAASAIPDRCLRAHRTTPGRRPAPRGPSKNGTPPRPAWSRKHRPACRWATHRN